MTFTSKLGIAATAFLLIGAGTASAATVLMFDPKRGEPGSPVVGTTVGAGMQGVTSGRVVVFLAPPHRIADLVDEPGDDRIARFGVMTADQGDIGHFIGEVPRVEPGNHVAVAYCRGCDGMFTVGRFTVTGPSLPKTGAQLDPWSMVALAVLSIGALTAGLTRAMGSPR